MKKEEKVKDQQEETPKEESAETQKEKAPEREPKPVTISDIELEKLEQERKEYKEKYLMGLAELENFRKRHHKERDELIQHAIANVLADFLQPLDNFEKALGYAEGMSDEVKNWAKGFEMILGQMHDALAQHGVVSFDSADMEFDPEFHEAVEVEETDEHPPGKILLEYVKGYKLGKRTLRPARVKVAKLPKKEEVQDEENNDENQKQGE